MDDFSKTNWYFTKKPRSIITIPLLLLVGINVIYHWVMAPLYWIDFLIGNPLLFFLFGWTVSGVLESIPMLISIIPIVTLPIIWEAEKIWGIFKIGAYIPVFVLSWALSNLMVTFNIWLLDIVATPRTTIWWSQLWGYA